MSIYRSRFERALRILGRISIFMREGGHDVPVLVGGAAVELYSGSAIATGDIDIVVAEQEALETILRQKGFHRPRGPGTSSRGWVHPELQLGFEVVGSSLLDGLADRTRLKIIDLGIDGHIAVISIEDLIADRMGQFASDSAQDMLMQARALLTLFPDVDRSYLERRIREETLRSYGVEHLEI